MRKFYTFLAACLLTINAAAADKIYAVFSSDGKTMTIYYDEKYYSRGGVADWINSSHKDERATVTKIVLDESLKNAKPTNLSDWFADFPVLTYIQNLDMGYLDSSEATTMAGMFSGCEKLSSIELYFLKTSKVKDFSYMFRNCKALTSLDVSTFNTSSALAMNSMFRGCEKLTSLNLSSFDTKNVTDMAYLFCGCKKLATIKLTGVDTKNVTSMFGMFENCNALEELDLSQFNTAKVTDMAHMFASCSALTWLGLQNFSFASLQKADVMFNNCANLVKIYCKQDFSKLSNLTSSSDMFNYCTKMKGGKGTLFSSSYTDQTYARPDEGKTNPGYFWIDGDTGQEPEPDPDPEPTDSRTVITECALEGFDVSSLYAGMEWTSAAADAIWNKLQNADPYAPYYLGTEFGLFKNPASVESQVNVGDILEEGLYQITLRVRLDGDYGTQYRFPKDMEADMDITVDGTAWTVDNVSVGDNYSFAVIFSPAFQVEQPAAPDKPEIYAVFDDAAKTMTLYYDKKRLDRDGVLEWWNTETDDEEARNEAVETVILNASMKDARPESTANWFEYFDSLTEIRHLDYLNTEDVEDMYSMFDECLSLENLDVSHFKTGKVKNMAYMFAYVPVKKLDLSNFDTKNVTNMAGMFRNCPELTELDLRSFDMSKVGWTSFMFDGCEKLKTIYCNADISELDGYYSVEMFKNCTSLVGGLGTVFDANHIDATYARPDEKDKPGYFTSSKQGLWDVQVNDVQCTKIVHNGQIFILRGEKTYTLQGQEVR